MNRKTFGQRMCVYISQNEPHAVLWRLCGPQGAFMSAVSVGTHTSAQLLDFYSKRGILSTNISICGHVLQLTVKTVLRGEETIR